MTDNLGKLLARIDEIIASKKFASEREWCRVAGVSASYIGALRTKHSTGEAKGARTEQIAKLARAAGVSVDWLLGADAPVHESPAAPEIDEVIAKFEWPEELEPQEAETAIRRLREERAHTTVRLPPGYWQTRLSRLVGEAMGRTALRSEKMPVVPIRRARKS